MPKLAEHLTEDQVFNLRAFAKGETKWSSLSPAEQQFANLIRTVTDEHQIRGGRDMPFAPRTEHTEIYDAAGIDPSMHHLVDQANATLRDSEIAASVIEARGGDDSQIPDAPLNLNDIVRASFEAHTGDSDD